MVGAIVGHSIADSKIEDRQAADEAFQIRVGAKKGNLLEYQKNAEEKGQYHLARQVAVWRLEKGDNKAEEDKKRYSQLIFNNDNKELIQKGEYAQAAMLAFTNGMKRNEIEKEYLPLAVGAKRFDEAKKICKITGNSKGVMEFNLMG